jgi:hypothetical protein
MQRSYTAFKFLLAAFAVTLLSSCAMMQSLGVPAPQTFNEKLAVTYGTVTAVREAATTLLIGNRISSDDAQNVQNAADTARAGLDTVRRMHIADPTGANNKLEAIRTGLIALQGYLATRQSR